MTRNLNKLLMMVSLLVLIPGSALADIWENDWTMRGINVREGVFVRAKVSILVNSENPWRGKTIVALHGFAHTGETYKPLAERLLSDEAFDNQVSKVVLINLPGRNGSSLPLPEGSLLFGDLTLNDYDVIVRRILNRLKLFGVRPDILIGHSMGGMILQMAQQSLEDAGKSLREVYGIKAVVLMAPTIPVELPWYVADSGIAEQIATPFVTFTPELGVHLNAPSIAWVPIFFGDLSQQVVPTAPTPAEVDANGYNAIEAFTALAQLIGAQGLTRPSVNPEVFSQNSGSQLYVATFEQDAFFPYFFGEHQALYSYLTGDSSGAGVWSISGANAVHDTYLSEPQALDGMFINVLSELCD